MLTDEIDRHELGSSVEYSLKVKTWLPAQALHPILGIFVTKQISTESPELNIVTVNFVTHDGMLSSYYVGTVESVVSSEVEFL
jgi:hypothetical protein